MELNKIMVFLMFMVAAFGTSMSKEIQLHWVEGTDYKKWASNNKFYVCDTIVFHFNPQRHNVYQVNKEDYEKCSKVSPIALYASGWDSVTLNKPGSYYFCGYHGHCKNGQKLKIKVKKGYKKDGHNPPCLPGQISQNTTQGYPIKSSSPSSKTANWFSSISTICFGIFLASYFCGFSL